MCLSAGVFAETNASWINPECESGECEVKAFRLSVTKISDAKMAGNSMVAEIETSKPEYLKKYAVVQFIKGCAYMTNAKGDVKFQIRSSLNKPGTPFVHKDFEIDSGYDADPVYNSSLQSGVDELRGFEIPRNAAYLNLDPNKSESARAWAGKEKNLLSSSIYVDDMPTLSNWAIKEGKLIVHNTSLQFKTCLYEVSKLPKKVAAVDEALSEPITCLDWSSNFLFDFKMRSFRESKEISPVCR
jgi:hypothetical protein